MSWGLVAAGAASVIGGVLGSRSSDRAARAQQRGADAATAESARQYDQTRQDLAPYRVTGTGALNAIARLYGLPTTTPEAEALQAERQVGNVMLPGETRLVSTDGGRNRHYDVYLGDQRIGRLGPGGAAGIFTNDTGIDVHQLVRERRMAQQQAAPATAGPDMSGFIESPDYQFRRNEGTRGIERSAAARGGAFSGNALRALTEFNSNLASGEFGNYFNRLASIAGIGQTATNQTAAYGADHASQAGRNAMIGADARASGIIGQGNAWANAGNNLAGAFGYWSQNRAATAPTQTGSPWATPNPYSQPWMRG